MKLTDEGQDPIEQAGSEPEGAATETIEAPAGGDGGGGGDGGDGGDGGGDGKTGGEPAAPAKSAFDQRMEKILEAGTGATDGADDDDAKGEGDGTDDDVLEPKPAAGKAGKGAKADEVDDDAGADADADDSLVLAFPGRREEDEDFEVVLDKETQAFLEKKGLKLDELVERANQARKGYGRRQEVEASRRDVEAQRASLEHIQTEIAERPLDFIADSIDEKQHRPIVETLLARMSDEDFTAIAAQVAGWEDEPLNRREARLQAKEAASTRKTERETAERTASARAKYVTDIKAQVDALVPEDMEDADAQEFFDFAAHKLQTWASRQPKGTKLDPAQVPTILEEMGALKPFGLSLPKPGKPGTNGKGKTGTPPVRPGSRPAAPTASSDPAARAARAGKDLAGRRDRRREAVASPAGAGAPAAQSGPPKGQTFDQRIDWLSKKLGLKK